MSFIEWITRRPGFRSLEDSFAINRESMLIGLLRAIEQQQKCCDEVWLVVHFFDAFLELQDFLGEQGIEYQIVDREFHGANLPTDSDLSTGSGRDAGIVRLALAALVGGAAGDGVQSSPGRPDRLSLAIIVCERHPHHVHDKRLFELVKQIDASITFGYVLSLDDVVVRKIVSPMALRVLKQLGLDDDELIASHYLSRLLERRLIRDSKNYAGDRKADSAAQWIELNSR